jgi:hypothetical protein
MVCDSGSEAEAVAMVVPVETFSAKDDAAKELERIGASLTSSIVIVRLLVVVFTPSEALKVKL